MCSRRAEDPRSSPQTRFYAEDEFRDAAAGVNVVAAIFRRHIVPVFEAFCPFEIVSVQENETGVEELRLFSQASTRSRSRV